MGMIPGMLGRAAVCLLVAGWMLPGPAQFNIGTGGDGSSYAAGGNGAGNNADNGGHGGSGLLIIDY